MSSNNIQRLLDTTLAGLMAKELDAKDGDKSQGYIDASVWNEFVKKIGVGKEIKTKISIENAMKSITTYCVREAAKLEGKTGTDIAREWRNDFFKEMGVELTKSGGSTSGSAAGAAEASKGAGNTTKPKGTGSRATVPPSIEKPKPLSTPPAALTGDDLPQNRPSNEVIYNGAIVAEKLFNDVKGPGSANAKSYIKNITPQNAKDLILKFNELAKNDGCNQCITEYLQDEWGMNKHQAAAPAKALLDYQFDKDVKGSDEYKAMSTAYNAYLNQPNLQTAKALDEAMIAFIKGQAGFTFLNEYDANDNGTKYTFSDGSYHIYEYDDNGNKTKTTFYNSDGSVDSVNCQEYDSSGKHIKTTYYNEDGLVYDVACYEYNSSGKHIKTTGYNSDGSVYYVACYEYDSSGKHIKTTSYDKDGRATEEITFDEKGIITGSTKYKYDENGNVTITRRDKDGKEIK